MLAQFNFFTYLCPHKTNKTETKMKKIILIAIVLAIYTALMFYAFIISENPYINAFIVPCASVGAAMILDHLTDKQTAPKSK